MKELLIMLGIETRDLIIVLPGITGSVLARQSPQGGKPKDLWAISGQALWQAVKGFGGSLQELEVPPHDPTGEAPATNIVATRVVLDFHGVLGLGKIDGYTELARTILDNFAVTDGQGFEWFPYDWRLSNRISARHLAEFIRPRLKVWRKTHGPDARLVLVAHSMGGLVARYYLEVLDGGHWRDCRALLTLGTPYRGSLNAANFLANGYKKWDIRLSTLTDVMRSCPSVYELLPSYRAIEVDGEWKPGGGVRRTPQHGAGLCQGWCGLPRRDRKSCHRPPQGGRVSRRRIPDPADYRGGPDDAAIGRAGGGRAHGLGRHARLDQ
jgi:pimeloyl-ACP methyl ester carboxylesterase